jgi:RNA polymerase sigma-70 factor (ECF subfamily)
LSAKSGRLFQRSAPFPGKKGPGANLWYRRRVLLHEGTETLTPSDDLLVRQALAGDLGSFDQLMLRYQKLVCKVAMNYVRDKQNALDVTQNVFLKVYKKLDSVKSEGMFKPWLLRITYNESINWLRRRKQHEEFEELGEHDRDDVAVPPQESRLLDQESRGLLLQGFAELNPKYKLAVALRYAEGMHIKEIAEVMDCSEGMVKSLLFRGVRKIRNNVAGTVQ